MIKNGKKGKKNFALGSDQACSSLALKACSDDRISIVARFYIILIYLRGLSPGLTQLCQVKSGQ